MSDVEDKEGCRVKSTGGMTLMSMLAGKCNETTTLGVTLALFNPG